MHDADALFVLEIRVRRLGAFAEIQMLVEIRRPARSADRTGGAIVGVFRQIRGADRAPGIIAATVRADMALDLGPDIARRRVSAFGDRAGPRPAERLALHRQDHAERADAGEITLAARIDEGRPAAVATRRDRAVLIRREPEAQIVGLRDLEIRGTELAVLL